MSHMCGRYGLAVKGDDLAELLELDHVPDIAPRYNIAPTQDVAVVRTSRPQSRVLTTLKWGLVPFWARDSDIAHRLINARCETVHEKKAFRWALRQRRCLIPSDGFYEWKKVKTDRLPHHFGLRDAQPFCMAGLWERWQSADGRRLATCTILTTQANPLVAQVHDRMPVILRPDQHALWMDHSVQDPAVLGEVYHPFPEELMEMWPVARHVSNPLTDGPQCRSPMGQMTLL